MRLWIGRDGRLLARCWACFAEWPAILAATGTEAKDWFPDDGDRRERPTRRLRIVDRIVATYDYLNEDGSLEYQTVRLANPKDFFQRRPMPGGGWANSLQEGHYRQRVRGEWVLLPGTEPVQEGDHACGPCRLLIYRLPELLAAPEQPVLVVEGEKDVQMAEALGFVATTNHGGAGKWHADFGQWLEGRRVVVIPDAGDAGWKHGGQVIASAIRHRAASIRLVELPEPARDLSHWVELCHPRDRGGMHLDAARADLIRLVRGTTEMRPASAMVA